MSLFDIVLLVIIGGFALFGVWFGLIHTLGSLVGTVLGVFLASRWYVPIADWLINTTGWSANFSKVVVFIIVFIIVNRLIGLAFFFVDRALSIFTRLPFLNGINRLLGLIFGIFEGVVVLGIIFYFITIFPLGPAFMSALASSRVAPICIGVASILWPLVPVALQALQDSLQDVM